MQKTKEMKIISVWFVSALLARLDRYCAVSVLTSNTRVHTMIEPVYSPGGGDSHIKRAGMLVVPLRG